MRIIVREREFRGVTYLGHGQRVETWLPPGDYEVREGVVTITDRDGTHHQAVELCLRKSRNGREVTPQTWYAAPGIVKGGAA